MKFRIIQLYLLLSLSVVFGQDWANLERYHEENARLEIPVPGENRVVFMGNSITESWPKFNDRFFLDNPFIPRGISGQTTPQMLLRFRTDVLELKPQVVVILAGTNDIAGNTGPMSLEMILGNIMSMAELARANGIKVVISSVLPAFRYPWKPDLKPAEDIHALNVLLKAYARDQGYVYLDYYKAMVDKQKGLKGIYTYDGVHPNLEGYKLMEPLAQAAIVEALRD